MPVTVRYTEMLGSQGPSPGFFLVIQRAIRVELPADATSETAPQQRFIDNGDGTITDTQEGKMWQKRRAKDALTYEEAIEYATALRLGGHSDWRVPEYHEFTDALIVELSPGIGADKTGGDTYWARSGPGDYGSGKLFVYDPGSKTYSVAMRKDGRLYVRCVRDVRASSR
jgi:hypothetical protein